MATYTDTIGFNRGSSALRFEGHRVSRQAVKLDFAAIAAARTAAGASALVATDVLQVLYLPAKTLVLSVGADCTTAEGATLTIGVGDGTSTSGYLTAFSLNSVTSIASALALTEAAPNTVTGLTGGKYYSAASTIDVLINTSGADVAVVTIWAVCVDCS